MKIKRFLIKSGVMISSVVLLCSMFTVVNAAVPAPSSRQTCSRCGQDFATNYEFTQNIAYSYQEKYSRSSPLLVSDVSMVYVPDPINDPMFVVKYQGNIICKECVIDILFPSQNVDSNGSADVPITVTRDAPTFSVTIPTAMPIAVSASGEVTTADNVAISNNSSRSVCVKSVAINTTTDWSLGKFDKAAMRSEAIDTKKLGFSMTMGTYTASTTTSGQSETIGSYGASDITIATGSQLSINYDGVIPAQLNGITSNTQAANVVFTIDWAE